MQNPQTPITAAVATATATATATTTVKGDSNSNSNSNSARQSNEPDVALLTSDPIHKFVWRTDAIKGYEHYSPDCFRVRLRALTTQT